MAGRKTGHTSVDYAFHRQQATRLRDLYIHHVFTRGLRRLSRPRPVAWSGAAALIAAIIGWMAYERTPFHGLGFDRPVERAFAPASLPIPAGLANATYDAN